MADFICKYSYRIKIENVFRSHRRSCVLDSVINLKLSFYLWNSHPLSATSKIVSYRVLKTHFLFSFLNQYRMSLLRIQCSIIWRPPSLSELTPIIFNVELIQLEASIY